MSTGTPNWRSSEVWHESAAHRAPRTRCLNILAGRPDGATLAEIMLLMGVHAAQTKQAIHDLPVVLGQFDWSILPSRRAVLMGSGFYRFSGRLDDARVDRQPHPELRIPDCR